MSAGLHYPDNLYADHEERKARARQSPLGAYKAQPEMPESERKLRTALAYVNHARDLIRDALGDNEPKAQREAKIAYDVATERRSSPENPERTPKWHTDWADTPPNCDGLKARDIRAPHPASHGVGEVGKFLHGCNPIADALAEVDRYARDDNASGV